jgi:hypothetical protein
VTLVAHLCHNLRARARFLHEQLRLDERACHRFLKINVLAILKRHHRDGEMTVVRSRSHHGVEVLAVLLEHLAEVGEQFRLRILALHLLCLFAFKVHITQCRHLYHTRALELCHVLLTAVSDADKGYLHLVAAGVLSLVCTCRPCSQRTEWRQSQACRSHSHLFEKVSSCSHYLIRFLLLLLLLCRLCRITPCRECSGLGFAGITHRLIHISVYVHGSFPI